MADSSRSRPRTFSVAQPLNRLGLFTQTGTKVLTNNAEVLLVIGLVLAGLVAFSINMFNYPSFTLLDDEGVYVGQARAVLESGSLTPYTYFYDHAPAGWIFMAAWLAVSGGLHTFGSAIDSGRMFMLLLHLAMIPLLYRVARKLGAGVVGSSFAALLFSLSPLAIFYERMVLLDSIMIFWVLLSLDLLLDGWGRLSRVILSGACFGIAFLTKETALFLVPAVLFMAVQQRWKHQGRFAIISWLMPFLLVASIYPLFAGLKGELLPAGQSFLNTGGNIGGGQAGKVSLIDAFTWQLTRDGGGLFNFNNQFWQLLFNDWIPRDAFLVIGGVVASFTNVGRGLLQKNRPALVSGLLGVLPLLYLLRGALVLNYFIIFAIPFFCLNIGILVALLPRLIPSKAGVSLAAVGGLVLVGSYWVTGTAQPLYQEQPSQAGRDAIAWVKENLPPSSLIISRDDLWPDLREAGLGGPAFPNVHSHYKVASDPAVRDDIFHNDWHNVDYLLMSPDLEKEFVATNNKIALDAFAHSHLIKQWTSVPGDDKLHPQQVVQLWKVDKAGNFEAQMLSASANYLNKQFEKDGAYVDSNGDVTAEAQAYALLRAVWSNDQSEFDRVWKWTSSHLQTPDGLMVRLWNNNSVTDKHTGSDADTDAALALLMASKVWNRPDLLVAGTNLVNAIWQHEVVTVKGQPYLTAGNWASSDQIIAFNPSYFAPYAYRIFGVVDTAHNWTGVIDTGYKLLADASNASLGFAKSAGLPPDWIGMNRDTGELVPLKLSQTDTTRYGFEAPRAYWRVALDLRWNNDGRARSYLDQAGFLRDEVNRILQDGITLKNRVSAIYAHDGSVVQEAPTMVGTAGAMAALLTLDPATGNKLYAGLVVSSLKHEGHSAYWDDDKDLYTQEWGWFAMAFYANGLTNLWQGQ